MKPSEKISFCFQYFISVTALDAASTTFQKKAPDFRGFFRFSPSVFSSGVIGA